MIENITSLPLGAVFEPDFEQIVLVQAMPSAAFFCANIEVDEFGACRNKDTCCGRTTFATAFVGSNECVVAVKTLQVFCNGVFGQKDGRF